MFVKENPPYSTNKIMKDMNNSIVQEGKSMPDWRSRRQKADQSAVRV